MAYSTLKLPPGIRENEPFDGELLGGRNKGFQSRRTYLLGPVIENSGGIRALVGAVSDRFRGRRTLLLVLISFLFYCFGSFLGLFEEMLTMLPIVTVL